MKWFLAVVVIYLVALTTYTAYDFCRLRKWRRDRLIENRHENGTYQTSTEGENVR